MFPTFLFGLVVVIEEVGSVARPRRLFFFCFFFYVIKVIPSAGIVAFGRREFSMAIVVEQDVWGGGCSKERMMVFFEIVFCGLRGGGIWGF